MTTTQKIGLPTPVDGNLLTVLQRVVQLLNLLQGEAGTDAQRAARLHELDDLVSSFSAAADARIAVATLEDLADVTFASLVAGQVLKRNAGNTAWENAADNTGAGGSTPTGTGFRRVVAGVEDAVATYEVPTAAPGTNTTQAASTAFVLANNDSALRADLATTGAGKGTRLIKHKVDLTGTVARDLQVKIDEEVSILDFGGVGDGVTNNDAAFNAAEASAVKRILLPPGNFVTTKDPVTLTKYYYGNQGVISALGGRLPGRYTNITTRPAIGTGIDYDRYFTADLKNIDAAHFRIGGFGNNIRKSLNEPYFESGTTPYFDWTTNHSGWSGTTAMVQNAASAGATSIVLNSVAGITVGNVLGLTGGASDPSYLTLTDTITVATVNGGTNTITFTPALTTSYPGAGPTAGRATHGWRTMSSTSHREFTHYGGGDMYAHLVRGVAGYSPIAGQNHMFFGSTIGIIGGDLSAGAVGNYITGIEIDHRDNGYASGCVGVILNFQRTTNRNARGETWTGLKLKSEGGTAIDTVLTFAGTATMGVDLTMGDFGTEKRAFGMKAGDRIGFNDVALVDSSGIYTLNGSPTAAATAVTLAYEAASKSLHLTNAQISATGMHDNSTGMAGTAKSFVGSNASGYDPTGVGVSNVDIADHAADGMYYRVGNLVTVSGQFQHKATASGSPSTFTFVPPIATTFAAARFANGTAVSNEGKVMRISGSGSNVLFTNQASDALESTFSYQYTYLVA